MTGFLHARLAARPQRQPWGQLIRGEAGISYSLPAVLIIPFYLIFVLIVFETGFLMLAKLGTLYAAHAAARSAIVWNSAQPAELREHRIRQAAATALAPFVGGRARELETAGPLPPRAREQARDYSAAFHRYAPRSLHASPGLRPPFQRPQTLSSTEFLERKYLIATARLQVEVETDTSRPDGPVRVRVRFRAPLYLPVVSRFLDPDGWPPFEYPLEAVAVLPNEAPGSADGTLGIDYHSWPDH